MTTRLGDTSLILACCVLAVGAGRGVAEPPQKPAGPRVVFCGNSWHGFVKRDLPGVAKAAGIEGFTWGSSNDLGLREEPAHTLLMKGEIDIFDTGTDVWFIHDLSPITAIPEVLERGLKSNADFRIYYQVAWLRGDGRHLFPEGRRDGIRVKEDFDASSIADVQAALDTMRRGVEARADELNRKHGKRVLFLVPVGDAVTKLRAMVVDGKFPGARKQSELFTDGMPHPGEFVKMLATYCHFAAVCRTSPVGLKMGPREGFTDEIHAMLQRIAWETVSRCPYAGFDPLAAWKADGGVGAASGDDCRLQCLP